MLEDKDRDALLKFWGSDQPNEKDKSEVANKEEWSFKANATAIPRTEDELRHRKILAEMADTFSKKNSDYGNAFEEILDDFGASYAVGRLKEKHKRLTKLITSNKQEVEDESIEDTLLDMANYAVLTIMWLQKQKERANNGK